MVPRELPAADDASPGRQFLAVEDFDDAIRYFPFLFPDPGKAVRLKTALIIKQHVADLVFVLQDPKLLAVV